MIIFAEDRYLPQIKEVWQSGFHDSAGAVDFYFTHRHRNENMLLYLAEGRVAAILSILPFHLRADNMRMPAGYIYGVATAPRFRGRGFSTALLCRAHDLMTSRGDAAAVLVPASDSLFDFYGKRGYHTEFRVDTLRIAADELPPPPEGAVCLSSDADELFRIRQKAFGTSRLFAEWDREALGYVVEASRSAGEQVYRFQMGSGEGCAVYERAGDRVEVKELALAGIEAKTALSILHKVLGETVYHLLLPAGTGGKTAVTRDFGMIRWLRETPETAGEPPYLSLVLD